MHPLLISGIVIGVLFTLIVILFLIYWFYPNGNSSTIDVNIESDKHFTVHDLKGLT